MMPRPAASAITQRVALWSTLLLLHGWALEQIATPNHEILIRARRPPTSMSPAVDLYIHETLAPGPDACDASRNFAGTHIVSASWHAQIAGGDPLRVERIDLDLAKESALRIHRHPLGQPNRVRVPLPRLPHPAQWVEHLELLAYMQADPGDT